MTPDQFPLVASALTGRHAQNFARGLQMLTQAEAAGGVNATGFKQIKDDLNRAFDAAHEILVKKPILAKNHDDQRTQALDDLYWLSRPECHTVAGVAKKLAKMDASIPEVQAYKNLVAEILPLAAQANALKTKIVKREPKPVEDLKTKYLAPMAGDAAIQQVRALLVEITNESYDGLRDRLIKYFTKTADDYLGKCAAAEANGGVLSVYREFQRDHERQIIVRELVIDGVKNFRGEITQPAQRKPGFEAAVAKMATKNADQIRESFVIKNLKKLDSIIEAKGDFASVEVVGTHISLGGLKGTLKVSFKDGASFVCDNTVVYSRSVHGKAFLRFPLTFHDVYFGDGARMKTPSEERMNTVFVGKVAEAVR